MNSIFNRKRLIENAVEVNIFYKRYRKMTKIDMIKEQKWNIILEMLRFAYYNSEIDQNKRGKENKMSKGMWEVVEKKIEKTRVVKVEGRREKTTRRRKQEENE